MTEVRRHQRTVDGKTVNVRHHTRSGTGTAAEKRQDAWEDRAAGRWTPPPRPETGETPAADETWWDDDEPRPEAWTDDSEPYPCAMCGGSGTSRLGGGIQCSRCGGSGHDPHVERN